MAIGIGRGGKRGVGLIYQLNILWESDTDCHIHVDITDEFVAVFIIPFYICVFV